MGGPRRAGSTAVAPVLAALALTLAGCATNTDGARILPSTARPLSAGQSSGELSSGRVSSGPSAPVTSRPASSSNTAAGYDVPAVVSAVLTAARRAVVLTNTYDYRHLPQFRARALTVATGTFREQFLRSYDSVLLTSAPAVRQVQQLTVTSAGLDGMRDADSATVLVTSTITVHNTSTARRVDQSGAFLALRRVSGRWLVANLVTVGAAAAPGTATGPATPGSLPGTAGLRNAAEAAEAAVRAISTIDHRTFDADYDRALALTTGALHADMAAHRSQLRRAVVDSGRTLSVRSLRRGVVSVQPARVVLLFTFETGTGSGEGDSIPQRLRITESRVQGSWLASDITALD